jgi:phosphoglycolate phosphatase-like HAD superfamily hydrolase
MKAVAIDLDAVLGDTRPLWNAWLEDAGRRARVDLASSGDRAQAAAELDGRLGNWRLLLERFAEDHAPVYLRPRPEATAALRALRAAGVTVGAFTDAPEVLARVALAHVGAARHVGSLEAGEGALARLLVALGKDAVVVHSQEELRRVAS